MSKGKSAILQKAEYQRRQPYTPQQRMNYEKCDCDFTAKMPPQVVLDRIADEKFSAGYKIGRKQVCQKHFIAVSKSGKCIECEAEE